jgi:hypothetical protein
MTAPARKPCLPARRVAGDRDKVLALYDAALAALDKAVKVDEVRRVHDTAEQIRLYGRQAQDTSIIVKGEMLRLNARRKLGRLLIAAKDAGELAKRGQPKKSNLRAAENTSKPLTLTVVGLSHNLSAESQKLAKLDEKTFGKVLAERREQITASNARVISPQSDVLVRKRKAERQAEVIELSKNPLFAARGAFLRRGRRSAMDRR